MEAVNTPVENIPELNGKTVNAAAEQYLRRDCWPLEEDEEKLRPFVCEMASQNENAQPVRTAGHQL